VAVAPEVSGSTTVSRGKKSFRASVSGVTPSYQDVRSWSPILGGFIAPSDIQERGRVAVIGLDAYRRLFEDNEYPIDQTIRINNLVFRVIGVMEERGGGSFGNEDESILIPLTTAQDRLYRRKTLSGDYQEQIAEVLRQRHGINFLDEDDFSIINQADLLSIFGDILGALTLFLGAIAGISLLVGGIGIMNIMLVSVTERTREIGLRKAVGAKRQDILGQFLIEAVTLAVLGGLLGIVLGTTGAQAISSFLDNFDAVVGIDAILISILFSMAVGLFFGIYPAYRASRLNPIDALRYE
jgi:putative ABC transport system permease protein